MVRPVHFPFEFVADFYSQPSNESPSCSKRRRNQRTSSNRNDQLRFGRRRQEESPSTTSPSPTPLISPPSSRECRSTFFLAKRSELSVELDLESRRSE